MDRSGAAILERPDRNGKQMLLTHTALEEYEKESCFTSMAGTAQVYRL